MVKIIWGWCVVLLIAAGSQADEIVCTNFESRQVENEAASLNSWSDMYQSFKRYGHCDDGAIAEGYSNSVAVNLTHWEKLSELRAIIRSDDAFRKFVLQHIDATIPAEHLKTISDNAKNHCQLDKRLCKQIRNSAERALADQKDQKKH